ncbi:helix-turn-helix domain-containing protein [Agrococcus sp. Marseille-P2731]|uniref:helix-turn-helix domain-containing protein n=1 Tax=Agrococcus sp. Marseille-P2731 TaxID=1841862 RepID=UPI000930065C|nr:helix-turn-helix domain-containing protein [Agrococcus sp. Marseille-P2731]
MRDLRPEPTDVEPSASAGDRPAFSSWLRDQMREQGLRGIDVARASNGLIGQSQVSRWLNGRSQPSLASSAAIASALGVPQAEVVEAIGADRHAIDAPRTPSKRAAVPVQVGFDGSRWRRDIDGERVVAKRLSDLLDAGEAPALDEAGSDPRVAEACARYREAMDQMEAAMRERSAALRNLVQAGMAVQDLAALLGVTPRGVEQRIRANGRRMDDRGRLG